jgi:hypothetical protein
VQRNAPPQYRQQQPQRPRVPPTWDDDSEGSGTANEDTPFTRAGPAGPRHRTKNPNVPERSYALQDDKGVRTNLGNTSFVMALLSEMWIINVVAICGGVYAMTFLTPDWFNGYTDSELWNPSCYWKLGTGFFDRSLDFTTSIHTDLFLGISFAI